MPEWSEDFSERSVEEILRAQEENKAWSKQLRMLSAALVNSRLAKEIGPEEYVVHRTIGKDDAAECRRRGNILAHEVSMRRCRM